MNPIIERRRPSRADLEAKIQELQATVHELSYSRAFGCLTRSALDVLLKTLDLTGLGAVYWDIDHLKQANLKWGKAESSRRIHTAIAARETDMVTAQVFSGDEFVAFPAVANLVPMAERLQRALREQEMSATFIVTAPRPGETPHQLLTRLDAESDFYKNTMGRGNIYIVV